MTGHIALFLAAAALALASCSLLALAAWRRAQSRAVRALTVASARVAAAVDVVDRVLDRLADQARITSLLAELAPAGGLDDALQRIADVATRLTGARGALVGVTGPGGERRVGSAGDVPGADATVGWPFEGVQAMTFATLHRAGSATRSTAYGAAVPLARGTGGSIGALTAFFDSDEAAAQGLAVLERVAAAAAPVLAAAAAAPTGAEPPRDLVTRLPTRVAFHEGLVRESARARRDGVPLALLIVDVDGFGSLNERAGPLAADRLLARVAETIDGLRPPDSMLYRVGGDAFGLVLPGRTGVEARGIAAELGSAQREQGAGIASLHLSTGVAELQSRDDAATLAARAQAALDATRQARVRSADEGG